MTLTAPDAPATAGPAVLGTGSRLTRVLGFTSLVGVAVLLVFAFVFTEADLVMQDAVRLLYVHVPMAFMNYLGFVVCGVGSAMVLWKRSRWWDVVAHAGAEVGVVFGVLMLATGVIWGRPTWNTWWEWGDARTMTALMLLLIYVGYLAYRSTVTDAQTRARRSAIIGVLGTLMIPIVRQSVTWWQERTLHQESSITDGNLEDLTLFTLFLGTIVFTTIFAWLMVHRFRIGWLEHQRDTVGLEAALAERRAQRAADIDDAVSHPGLTPKENA